MKTVIRCLLFGALLLWACEPKPECTANKDCTQEKQACVDQKCADVECTQDSHCSGNAACGADNKCKTAPGCPFIATGGCCEDKDCTEAGATCVENACKVPEQPCTTDEECATKDPKLPRCADGKCVEADTCKSNDDCKDAAKPECKDGTCVAASAAKIGEACDKSPCEADLVCYAEVGTPFCRQTCDPFNAVCRGGNACAYIGDGKGACVPRNNGKGQGESCVSQSCERNLFCVDWTSKVCARPCRPDKTDCSDQESCFDFGNVHLCVPKSAECGPGRPCTDSWTCDEKKSLCVPPTCPSVACKDEEICKFGKCAPRNCCNGDPCGAGKVCNHQSGQCTKLEITIPFCTNCLANGSCASASQRCVTLSGGDDKLCADECTATKKCTDPLMTCVKQSDDRYFCLPQAGTCQRDRCDGVSCNAGEACLPLTKACVKIGLDLCQACSDDLQCGGPTDKCIKADGAKEGYCARDCSGCATCPSGYTCTDRDGGKQCLPSSGACK